LTSFRCWAAALIVVLLSLRAQQLLEAVLESDVVRVYHLLAQGASLDYQDANKKYA
jgi:hypothetical protein